MLEFNEMILNIKNLKKNGGFIKTLFIVIVAIIILSFFIDFKTLIESKKLQDNYLFLKNLASSIWGNYISSWASYFWNKIIIEYAYKDLFLKFIWPKIHLKAP